MTCSASPEPARDDERAAAFALLFQGLPPEERRLRLANALELVRSGELDPAGIFVLRAANGLRGVVVCLAAAGAPGLLWPPCVPAGASAAEREDRLTQHALDWLRGQGVKLVQCLLSPAENHLANPLLRNGFVHV